MIDTFYREFWYPLSLILFHLVTLPSMSMFPLRFRVRRWQKALIIVAAAVLSGLFSLLLRDLLTLLQQTFGFHGSYFQSQLRHLIAMVVFCSIVYNGNFYSMLLAMILALSLAGQAGFVYGSLITMICGENYSNGWIIVRDILGYGTFALYYWVLRRYSNVTSFYLSVRDHLILIVIVFFHFFISCFSVRYLDSTLSMLLFYSVCSFATIAITFLLFRFTKEHEDSLRQQILLQDMKLSESALSQMQEASAQMKEMRHELGNHFIYIESLVEQEHYDELREYLHTMDAWSEEAAQTVTTANPVVNSIINQKLSYARSLGMTTQASVVLPEQLPLDDLTLCSLLGNLLNNAIDACQGQTEPVISIQIYPLKGYLIFRIENSVTYDVLKDNPQLQSTKADAENHGIGLRVARRIVKENNGILHYEMSAPERFCVQVMLQISD